MWVVERNCMIDVGFGKELEGGRRPPGKPEKDLWSQI
jgi:hypothetical protein